MRKFLIQNLGNKLKDLIFFIGMFFLFKSALATDPEFEKSNHYRSYSREVGERSFENFKTLFEGREKVMIFGTGHTQEQRFTNPALMHPKNVYMVDIDLAEGPDLLMHTDIKELPIEYVGQFDVVIFEGFWSGVGQDILVYERNKAFSNVYKILKKEGIFLLCPEDDETTQLEALKECNFQFLEKIKTPDKESKYVGCMARVLEDKFLRMQKIEAN